MREDIAFIPVCQSIPSHKLINFNAIRHLYGFAPTHPFRTPRDLACDARVKATPIARTHTHIAYTHTRRNYMRRLAEFYLLGGCSHVILGRNLI